MKKTFLSVILSMTLIAGGTEACELKMAWDAWAPYQMNENGKVTGFDIEVAEGIAKTAGCNLTLQELNWARIMSGIADGSVDMTLGASITPEREQFAMFSDPYREEKMVLFVRAGEAGKFNLASSKDIIASGMKVSVVKDYSYGADFDNLAKDAAATKNIDVATDANLNVKKVLAGRTDGFMDDLMVGVYLAKQNNAADKIEAHPVAVSSGPVSFMFSKKVAADTVAKFNQAIKDFKATPEYQAIFDKYTK